MAGTTTAYVFIAPAEVGPFGNRSWRVRNGIALVEKHLPLWMPAAIAHGADGALPVGSIVVPGSLPAAEQLALLAAGTAVRDPDFMQALREHGLTRRVPTAEGPVEWLHFADDLHHEGWKPPRGLINLAIGSLRDRARLGIVRLEPDSWLDSAAAGWLRERGLDVDEYELSVRGDGIASTQGLRPLPAE